MDNQPIRMLSVEDIWAANDIEERIVQVPQWGGAVRIKTLSQKQSSDLRRRATRTNQVTRQSEIDNDLLEMFLFIEGVIDPKFTAADYGKLQDKSMSAVQKVLKEIMDASGLTEDSMKDATKSTANGLGAEIRVLPGSDVGDDAP